MRKIREVWRLKAEGLGDRQIAAAIGSARSTVQECLSRCRKAGIAWPLPPELTEAALHERLYRRSVPLSRTPQPDFAYLHAELKRRGVTRLLLWEEYKTAHPDGWQYSVFCDQYRRWLARQEIGPWPAALARITTVLRYATAGVAPQKLVTRTRRTFSIVPGYRTSPSAGRVRR